MNKPRLLRATYFVWMIVPAAVCFAYLAFGVPHMLWSYDWTATGPDSYNDFSQRHYTRCTYIGPYGLLTIRPSDGTCGLVRFAKSSER